MSEFIEQSHLFTWLNLQHPDLLACSQVAGANLSKAGAGRAKAGGYKKGFPDVSILKPSGKYHGLFIEMKKANKKIVSKKTGKLIQASKGVVSPEQKDWINKLNDQGYLAVVCYGFDEAKEVIERYLIKEKI